MKNTDLDAKIIFICPSLNFVYIVNYTKILNNYARGTMFLLTFSGITILLCFVSLYPVC